MNIEAEKISLAQMLLGVRSKSILEQVRSILTKSDEIVAYSVTGEPLTLEAYNKELEKAENNIKEGKTITSNQLTKNMENWRK